MYAIFEDGSRQYRVSPGNRIWLDYRDDVDIGSRLELDRVLMAVDGDQVQIGQPLLKGVRVLAEVISFPSTKTYIQKYRRRKNYKRLKGHRQPFINVEITHILQPGEEAPSQASQSIAPVVEEPTNPSESATQELEATTTAPQQPTDSISPEVEAAESTSAPESTASRSNGTEAEDGRPDAEAKLEVTETPDEPAVSSLESAASQEEKAVASPPPQAPEADTLTPETSRVPSQDPATAEEGLPPKTTNPAHDEPDSDERSKS